MAHGDMSMSWLTRYASCHTPIARLSLLTRINDLYVLGVDVLILEALPYANQDPEALFLLADIDTSVVLPADQAVEH